jgi:hypothetical protein
MTCRSKAASRTLRASGQTCASVGVAEAGQTGTRPKLALKPKVPVNAAGMRIEPPPSVPSANGVIPAATEAAQPALEPPGVSERSSGLRVTPVSGESPTGLQPNSLVVDFPMRIAPLALARSTEGASTFPTLPSIAREPKA